MTKHCFRRHREIWVEYTYERTNLTQHCYIIKNLWLMEIRLVIKRDGKKIARTLVLRVEILLRSVAEPPKSASLAPNSVLHYSSESISCRHRQSISDERSRANFPLVHQTDDENFCRAAPFQIAAPCAGHILPAEFRQ